MYAICDESQKKNRHNVADVAHGSAHVMNEIASVFLDY